MKAIRISRPQSQRYKVLFGNDVDMEITDFSSLFRGSCRGAHIGTPLRSPTETIYSSSVSDDRLLTCGSGGKKVIPFGNNTCFIVFTCCGIAAGACK